MLVKDVMNREVITVSKDESLTQLIAKFRKHNCHILPVISESKKILGPIAARYALLKIKDINT